MMSRQETRQSKSVKKLKAVMLARYDGDVQAAFHDMAVLAVQRQKEERQTRAYAEALRVQLAKETA